MPAYGEKKREMHHRPTIPITIAFIIGILTGHYIFIPHLQLALQAAVLLISATLILSLFLYPRILHPAVITLFFLFGILFIAEGNEDSRLLDLANKREKVIIDGTVLEPSQIIKNLSRIAVRVDKIFLDEKQIDTAGKVRVIVYHHPVELLPGHKIRFPAKLSDFKNFNNPGRYNQKMAMRVKGFSCGANVSDGRRIVVMGKGSQGLIPEVLEKVRDPVRDLFKKKLAPQNSALLNALILGERQGIDTSLRDIFNKSGLGHILAVSGLHIGLVAWLVFSIATRLFSFSYFISLKTDTRRLSAIVTCFPVIAYTFISGFHISGQRSMIMVIIYLFSIILGREKDIWSSLCIAALVVLVLDPYAIFTASFQLSFIAVTGILLISPFVYNRVTRASDRNGKENILQRARTYFFGVALVTLSATLFLLPVTMFYFSRVPLLFLPANIMVVPLLGLWILPLGLISSICVFVCPALADILVVATGWGLDLMVEITRFWTVIPWSSFHTIKPNLFEMIIFYSLVFTLFHIRKNTPARIGLIILLSITLIDISYWIYVTRFAQKLRVTYFDVGQGNSALIRFPGHKRMLIDGGGFHRNDFDVGRMVIAPSLWHSKLNKIDYIVLSHPQSDHMGGLNFIASNFNPDEFWYNGNHVENISFRTLMNTLETKNIKTLLPEDLVDGINISGVDIKVLHPFNKEAGNLSRSSSQLNNNSLVIKLSYNGKSFLFPGDIEISGEKVLLQNTELDLKSDILLAPHHGSKNSCSNEFLRAVRPVICVISSGRNNYFGFPHAELLRRLEKFNCEIFRIDQVGAVKFSVGGGEMKIKSYLNEATREDP